MGELPARLGTKLGPRIAMLVSQAMIYTHTSLVHVRHKLAMMIFHAISDEISDEVDITLGPLLNKLHDAVDEQHPSYPYVHFLATATGQLKALAGTGLQVTGILGSIAAIMNNELADVVYNVIRANPGLLPDPGIISQAFAAGLVSEQEAKGAIGAQGIQYGWADYMLLLSKSYPSVTDGLELMRRGLITQDQFALWTGLQGVPEDIVALYLQLITGPVSAADAALGVLRGNISQQQGTQIAAENGFDPASFQLLLDNTGEPPGLQQLLEGYRRGFITKAELERGILQSRYRNEWIPFLERLRYSPMSIADAVNSSNQGHLDVDTARSYADQNGLEPGQFDILLATAGEPLSRTEMEQLYNRGLVTRDQVDQALRESRVKNKYIPLAFALHEKVLPVFTLQTALRYGTIDQARAIATMMEDGYKKEDATALASAASAERLKPYHDKILAQVQNLVIDSIISPDAAAETIKGLGYTDEQAGYITQAAELHREAATYKAAVGVIRQKYVSHHIDRITASGYLDQLGIMTDQRDQLLALWDIEAAAFTRDLTPAQVVKAAKNGLIEEPDALARLEAMGYNQVDAGLLLQGA